MWAFDLLYPLRCAGCGRFDIALCAECLDSMERATDGLRCAFCRARWEGDGNCPRCMHMHDLEGIRAAFEMAGPARSMVHSLKYGGYRAVAPTMGAFLSGLSGDLQVDRWFSVPLHGSRVKERGFNQSELLLKAAGWHGAEGLERSRKTDRQVGQHLGQRRANVEGAFVYHGPRLDGLAVGLVDDVVTTGATVAECARVLRDAGARRIWVVAFARASYREAETEAIDD